MFSARTSRDASLNPLAAALAEARVRARDHEGPAILDLTVSNPTRAGIPYDEKTILAALNDRRSLRYSPEPFGLLAAREAVAAELGAAVPASRIVLTASTSEAYAFLFKLLCDPGDEVLIAQPSYPLFELLATFEGVKLVPYRLAYDGGWHIDFDSLRRAVSSRTRAVFVVSPNNPTGTYLKRFELAAIAELGLPIVSDEVFARYPLREDPDRVTTVLEREGALLFALGGLSKLAALPQMKVAWTAVGGEASRVAEALGRLELLTDSFLSVSAPVQHALPALLSCGNVAADAIRARTRRNFDHLRAQVGSDSPLSVLDAEGGWYATVRVPATRTEEAWAIDLIRDHGVYVHPGQFFGFESEAYLVVSLLTPENDFDAGVEKLARATR